MNYQKMANVCQFVVKIKLGQIYSTNVIIVLKYLVLYVQHVHYYIRKILNQLIA